MSIHRPDDLDNKLKPERLGIVDRLLSFAAACAAECTHHIEIVFDGSILELRMTPEDPHSRRQDATERK